MSFRGTIPDFMLANAIYTGARVSFYTVSPDTGLRTSTLATLYTAPTGARTAANPQTLDSEGKFAASVYIDEPVIAEVVGPNVGSHTTGPIAARGRYRGVWVTGTRYFVEDFIANPLAQHQVYIAAQDFTAGASFAADLAAGKLQLELKGGDTLYFVVDDAGLPASGERWRAIISEESSLVIGAPYSYANALVAATASTVFSIKKKVSGVETEIGTITFGAAATAATIAVAATVTFPAGSEIAIVAPTRDVTLSGFAATLRLERNPT